MYLGDYAEDETIYLIFNTFSSDDPSASCTITNFINTDVHIHKDDGLVQRNNAAGITVSTNFDGITGSHMVKIDTNDNTVAGFWVTGADYFVRIEGTTVDGATINAVVGHFSIQNRYMRGTAGANTTVPDAAGVAPTAAEIKTEVEQAGSSLALILADTGELQTDWENGGRLDLILDIIAADTTTDIPGLIATTQADLDTITGSDGVTLATAQALYAPNKVVPDAAGVAATPAEVATALADINLDHLIKIAVDTDWGTTVHLDSVIGHMADVGTAATFDRTQESMEAIRARGDTAWTTGAGGSAPTVGEIRAEMEGAGYKLALIEADTNELQTNQSNWITATGFNTVVPDAAGVAPTAAEIKIAIEAAGSHLALILADTGELQTNQGAWVTATGFSIPNEYNVAIAALQTDLDLLTGVDGATLATLQANYAPNKVVPDATGTAAGLHATTDEKVDALNDITVADIIAGISDGTLDLQEMMRIILSATAGKSSGGGTVTLVFRDAADSKARITATVDANGNRTAMTLDGA